MAKKTRKRSWTETPKEDQKTIINQVHNLHDRGWKYASIYEYLQKKYPKFLIPHTRTMSQMIQKSKAQVTKSDPVPVLHAKFLLNGVPIFSSSISGAKLARILNVIASEK